MDSPQTPVTNLGTPGGDYSAAQLYGGSGPAPQPNATGVPDHAPGPEPMARTVPGPRAGAGILGNSPLLLVAMIALALLLVNVTLSGSVSVKA